MGKDRDISFEVLDGKAYPSDDIVWESYGGTAMKIEDARLFSCMDKMKLVIQELVEMNESDEIKDSGYFGECSFQSRELEGILLQMKDIINYIENGGEKTAKQFFGE